MSERYSGGVGSPPLPGALVISLDFELRWGVRARTANGAYHANLLGARAAIPRMLGLFEEFEIAATWATVGFLFAESREERQRYSPVERPAYADPRLSPYDDPTGASEADDALRYAPSLIDAIRRTPRQEIATHTFSHYYCTERGQNAAAFEADLAAACAIAAARGIELRSIVFPRNQHNPAYDEILVAHGITAYRGNPRSWMWRFADAEESATRGRRLARLVDMYANIGGHDTVPWSEVPRVSGLCNVRASRLLAPYRPALRALEPLRLARICRGIRAAAERRELYHLWWHPHNFGAHLEENLAFLRRIVTEFARCREDAQMQSLSMLGVSRMAREARPARAIT